MRIKRALALRIRSAIERCLLADIGDLNVEQHGRRIYPRTDSRFACLSEI
jgi:hypothetical protein